MTSLEQALSDTFAAVAQEAPHDLGLLSRVQVAATRHRRTRRAAVLVGAMAAVTAIAVGVTVLPGRTNHADRFTDPTGFLVDNRSAEKAFPFTPSYLPAGVTGDPLLDVYASFGSANYLHGGVAIQYSASTPANASGTATTVDGKPGLVSCGGSGPCRLSWQRNPSAYVTVQTYATEAETRRIAEGLRDEPLVQKPTVVLGLLPATGCHLALITATSTSYNDIDGGRACPVDVQVLERGDTHVPSGTVIDDSATIGGYEGKLLGEVDRGVPFWDAVLELGGGRRLVVTTPQGHGWDRAELDRFVRAIVLP